MGTSFPIDIDDELLLKVIYAGYKTYIAPLKEIIEPAKPII